MSNRNQFKIVGRTGVVMETSELRQYMDKSEAPPKFDVKLPLALNEAGNTIRGENQLFLHGLDNQFPQKFKRLLGKSPIYKVGLKYSGQQLAGLGLQTGFVEIENDKEVFKATKNLAWRDYEKRANFFRNYYARACRNLKTWDMVYVLVSMSSKGLIANTTVLANDRCRLFGNTLTGEIKQCVVADWSTVTTAVSEDNAQFYPVIDNWYNTAETFRERVRLNPTVKEYVYVLRMPTDDVVYNLQDHYTMVESGLLDYANNTVNFKKWVQENLTTLDKIIFISDDYMKAKYPEWDAWYNAAEKGGAKGTEAATKIDKAYEDVVSAFQNSASGIEKGGKTMTAPMGENGTKSIEVVKIEQNDFDGSYSVDNGWVEHNFFWALQIDAGLYSSIEGKNNNGGSAKTQTFNITQLNEWMAEQTLLEVPQFIADFNGYNVETFQVRRAVIYSSDAISSKDRQTQNPLNN